VIKQSEDGKKIIFECRLVADPEPRIEWFHKGKFVREDGRHRYILHSDKHNHVASLEISKLCSEDGGDYKLVAKNKHGQGFANINLNFEDGKPKLPDGKAPKFPKKPTIRQVGGNLVLECLLEANPFPKITWYHKTQVIQDGLRHKINKQDVSKDTYLLSLEIKEPSSDDGGTYKCNAVNELGESNANIALNFQGGDDEDDLSPAFVTKPKIIPKNGGSIVLMECRVKSTTKLITTWFKNGEVIKETTRIKCSSVQDGKDEYIISLELKVSQLSFVNLI